MSLGNHSSLRQSENYWRYSSSCYSKTTRRLVVNSVVRHSLTFSCLIGDITIYCYYLVLSQSFFSPLSYLLVSDVGNQRT